MPFSHTGSEERWHFPLKKQISLRKGVVISVMTALAASLLTALVMIFVTTQYNTKLQKKFARLYALDTEIRKNYYLTDIDDEALMNAMLKGYVSGLGDPYSTYLTEEELADSQDDNAGHYVGIGISVVQSATDNTVLVKEVMPDSPAEAGGILPDDYIIRVDDLLVADDAAAAIEAIKGKSGTEVTITVCHSDGNEYTTTMKRASVDEQTIAYQMLTDDIGYIHIKKFRTVTVKQFSNAYASLLEQGAKGILFDVRDNGGGLLSALEKIVDPLLPEGELAFAYDQNGTVTSIIDSDAECADIPMVVLTNGNTASAAELFACLLRDYADAVLVGETTFGKGIMQTTYTLPDGGGLTLTTATYSTGKTECYHGVGLTPDVESPTSLESATDTQLSDAKSVLEDLLKTEADQ